jgi:hypothetical protein
LIARPQRKVRGRNASDVLFKLDGGVSKSNDLTAVSSSYATCSPTQATYARLRALACPEGGGKRLLRGACG